MDSPCPCRSSAWMPWPARCSASSQRRRSRYRMGTTGRRSTTRIRGKRSSFRRFYPRTAVITPSPIRRSAWRRSAVKRRCRPSRATSTTRGRSIIRLERGCTSSGCGTRHPPIIIRGSIRRRSRNRPPTDSPTRRRMQTSACGTGMMWMCAWTTRRAGGM